MASKASKQDAMVFTAGFAVGAIGFHALAMYRNKKKQAGAKLKLYAYDHCPFCTRVRTILGLKSVEFELIYMESHDFDTPIGLVGAKQAPILVLPNGKSMAESMDIVKFIDANYNGNPVLAEASNREDLSEWIKKHMPIVNRLIFPRYHKAHMAEFSRCESREYFRSKKEAAFGKFDELIMDTPKLIKAMEKALAELQGMFKGPKTINESLSYDDIDLFGKLRGLTIVKDLKIPKGIRGYLDSMSSRSDVLLFDGLQTI